MGSILHMAHAQDFERRKRTEVDDKDDEGSGSSDDEIDNAEEEEVEEIIARADALEREELLEEPEEEEGEPVSGKAWHESEGEFGDAGGVPGKITPGSGRRSPGIRSVLGRSPNNKSFLDMATGTVRRKPKEGGDEE